MLPISVQVPEVRATQSPIDVSTQPLKILPIIKRQIGDGGQGVVYEGDWKTTKVAVKFTSFSNKSKPLIENEIEALSKLKHPNICALVGWYTKPIPSSTPMIALVTDFYSGGDLFAKVIEEQMSENKIMLMFRQLFDAVFYIHSKDVMHCDIKLENIVLTADGTPILIDFGLTNRPNAGTLYYAAPEAQYMLHKGLDIWAIGICLWACLTQSFPFAQAHINCLRYEVALKLMKSKSTSMCDAIYSMSGTNCLFSLDVKHLLDSMLCVDHKRRYTIGDVQDSMRVYCNIKADRKADRKADEKKACNVGDVEKKRKRIVY
jgi:serine/threonine protein kinase